MLTEELRQEQVKIAHESIKWLEKYSDNKDYQTHLYNLVELIKLTEMELSIYKLWKNIK